MRRDALIVADRARGLGWARIAERHKLSDRQCRAIFREHMANAASVRDHDPLAAVEEALVAIDAIVEDAVLLFERTGNPSVQVAALKLRLAALADRFRLQQVVGLIPHDLGLVYYQADAESTSRAIVRVLNDHGVSDVVKRDIQQAISPISAIHNGQSASSALR